ncbi:MAG TPA: DUF4235 domain-containing protein [Solirubrobacterales bacterium]
MIAKVLFIPFSIAGSLIAGMLSKKLFDFIWARFDDAEPPEAEHRDVSMAKLVAANAVQGAIFRGVRAGSDRGSRAAFYRATGVWPGEKEPDEAKF